MNKSDAASTILIAEDEPMVAMLLEDLLVDCGYRVLLGETLAKATELAADESIDAAILDVSLGRHDSFPLADALRQRSVPFLFASGHGRDGLPERFSGSPVLQKPYDMKALQDALEALLSAR